MSLIDSILTIILPFLLVLIINLAIIIKMVKYKKSKDLTEGLNQTTKETAIELVTMDKAKVGKEMSLFKNRNYILDKKPLSAANAAADDMISALPRQKSESLTLNLNEINNQIRNGSFNSKIEIIRRKRVYWRMTNILLAITTSFLILNFPFCFLKLRYFIRGFSSITIKPHIQYTTNVLLAILMEPLLTFYKTFTLLIVLVVVVGVLAVLFVVKIVQVAQITTLKSIWMHP